MEELKNHRTKVNMDYVLEMLEKSRREAIGPRALLECIENKAGFSLIISNRADQLIKVSRRD